MNLGWHVFAASLHRQRLEVELGTGLMALVELYYDNYTDATQLEPEILRAMAMLCEESMVSIDVEELVRVAEKKLNDEGGVEGSDGVKHPVCTFEEEK